MEAIEIPDKLLPAVRAGLRSRPTDVLFSDWVRQLIRDQEIEDHWFEIRADLGLERIDGKWMLYLKGWYRGPLIARYGS